MYIIPSKVIGGTDAGTIMYNRKGVGMGKHKPTSKCHTFNLIVRDRAISKSIFNDKKSIMEELLIPAAEQAGFKDPKSMANTFRGWGLKEGWLIEV